MSFLKSPPITGGIGAALHPTAAAQGLGHLLNISPTGIGHAADMIGKVSNGIAAAGGAAPGYASPTAPDVNNHLQLLDPAVLQAIMQQMRGGQLQTGSQFQGGQSRGGVYQ